MITAGVLLAAGASHRFGTADKLLAPLHGRPLVSYAADALRRLAPDVLIAVAASREIIAALSGFVVIPPVGPDPSQSGSLRAAIRMATEIRVDRTLIVLGDMPMVSTGLLQRVLARADANSPAAATDGRGPLPPVCWPRHFLPALLRLEGDEGARSLMRGLSSDRLVAASPGELVDVDTEADLARLNATTGNGPLQAGAMDDLAKPL